MGFQLRPDHAPGSELDQLLQKQIARAARAARHSSQPAGERARQARLACKKIRAILQLVPPRDPKTVKRPDRLFRDAARQLSAIRDHDAAMSTLERLRQEENDPIHGPCFYIASRAIAADRNRNHGVTDSRAAWRGFSRLLRKGASQLEKQGKFGPEDSSDFEWAADGFRTAYARARRSYHKNVRKPSADALHRWRKQAKVHRYHCTLLGEAWPAMMQPWQESLRRLGAALGYERDLALLSERIIASLAAQGESHRRIKPLLKRIARRRQELRDEAFTLGKHLFAEKPQAATRRVAGWWKAGPPPLPR